MQSYFIDLLEIPYKIADQAYKIVPNKNAE